MTDEHLMVWYQLESFSDFKKLYGQIDGKLEAGKTYEISVEDNYNIAKIGTEKYIFLSEMGIFGGRNFVLAGIFFGTALILALILLFFFCCYFRKLHKKNRDSEDFINSLTY